MDEIGVHAEATGLTPEIVESLLPGEWTGALRFAPACGGREEHPSDRGRRARSAYCPRTIFPPGNRRQTKAT
jgi:hypothetical protein